MEEVLIFAGMLFLFNRVVGGHDPYVRPRSRRFGRVDGRGARTTRGPTTPVQRAYRLLNARPDMPFDKLRECFRKAIFAAHPDRGGTNEKAKRVYDAWRLVQEDHEMRLRAA